jgi:hypothetical protein
MASWTVTGVARLPNLRNTKVPVLKRNARAAAIAVPIMSPDR